MSSISLSKETLFFRNSIAELHNLSSEGIACLYAYWMGYMELSNEEAMLACEKSWELIAQQHLKIMISNHDRMEGATPSYIKWVDRVYFPEAIKAGLRVEIVIQAKEFIAEQSLRVMYSSEEIARARDRKEILVYHVDSEEKAYAMARSLLLEPSLS